MIFKKKRASLHEEKRNLHRTRLPHRDLLSARLAIPNGVTIPVEVVDMNLLGAGVKARYEHTRLTGDDVTELEIFCERDGWTITALVRVRHIAEEEGVLAYGFEFLNLGNLYGKIGEAFGRYFNRRQRPRVRPELDAQPVVELAYKHFRPRAPIHDISVTGLCAGFGTIEASPLTIGDRTALSFTLPGVKRDFEGFGTINHKSRSGVRDFVGIEFDLEEACSLTKRHSELVAYIDRRRKEIDAFGRALGV